MAGVLSLAITFLLAIQVYGRPSYYRENRPADNVAYDGAQFYNKLRLFGARKYDDSEVEANAFQQNNKNGRARESDVRNADLRVSVENARDGEQVPPGKNRNEKNHFRYGEARGLDSKENDDSSEGHRMPFQNHNGAMGPHGDGNDDSSFGEYGSLNNRHGKGHVITDDVLQGDAFVAKINANDDSVSSEEENMTEAALASKFIGRGNDVNGERLDDRVDIHYKRRLGRASCAFCCLSIGCARAHYFCRCFR